MTRDQVVTAVNKGIPFLIRMADGEKYEVKERNQIALGRTSSAVFQEDVAHILPLMNMTGISYLSRKK